MTETSGLETISRTAVAGLSSYAICGIPLAQEFLDLVCKDGTARPPTSIFNPAGTMPPEDLVRREVHCRAMDAVLRRLLDEGRADTILEFASGMSPRGLGLVKDYAITYIETDLSDDFARKKELCDRVADQQKMVLKGRHLYHRLDAITMEGLTDIELPSGKPLILTNTGLMSYHPPIKRERFVHNVIDLMNRAPGSVWVTPDFSWLNRAYFRAAEELSSSYARHHARVKADFKTKLGVDYDKDLYADERQIEEHLNQLGLRVQRIGQPELGFAVQSASLIPGIIRGEFLALVKNSINAWVMRRNDG